MDEEGVCIRFDDPTGEIRSLLLMDTQYKNRPYVLYKISFADGDLSGCHVAVSPLSLLQPVEILRGLDGNSVFGI